ncbi:MAG: gliding motility-associated C-terminal domain-containing protein [Bacteroidia bacterium]|nr:gliding motility-associated C-terminal domain-containing protein [Bacteroidia bacterium]
MLKHLLPFTFCLCIIQLHAQHLSTASSSGKLMACGTCAANAGFETTNTNDWIAQSGTIGNFTGGLNFSTNTPNTDVAQHTIVTSGNDEVGGFPRVCNLIAGNTSSLRLGNAGNNSGSENISYQFIVNAATPFFTYYYAVVLEGAGNNHTPPNQSRFTVSMTDGTNTPIQCAAYEINGSNAATIGGFTNVQGGLYKEWTPVIIPLNAFVGQCVTISFETRDCNFGDHFGYAYIDADCSTPIIKAPPINCDNLKSNATLYGPIGAGSYTWTGPNIQGASNLDSVVVAGAGHWDCLMTTKTSNGGTPCTFTLSTDILPTTFTPKAQFTYNTACAGDAVSFNNTTTPNNVWTDYAWDLGNNGTVDAISYDTSDVQFPNTTQQPISIPVKLSMSNNYCTADTVIFITINPKPIANAGVNVQVCNGSSVLLNSSTNSLYEWYNGLNQFFTVANTTQSYTTTPLNSDSYTLVVTNQYGCKDTDDVYVKVNPSPIASFMVNDVCYPNVSTFTNTTSNTAVGDVYTWTLETGSTSNTFNTNYTYTSCGVKPVKLVVTSVNGCVSVVLNTANIYCKPKASITATNECIYDSAVFNAINFGATAITSYNWDFNYGAASIQLGMPIANNTSVKEPSNLYTTDGTKNIALIVTNSDGCKDSLVQSIIIYPVPVAAFSTGNVCRNDTSIFTSISTINAPDNIVQYQWDYNNDGVYETTATTNTQKYVYPYVYKGGAYLITTSNHGCKDTTTAAVDIYPLPTTKFEAKNSCENTLMQFTNTTTIAYGNITSSTWQYTPTNSATTIGTDSSSFTFSLANNYNVLLTTTSNFGCVNTKLKTVTAYPNPNPNFTVVSTKGCAPFCLDQTNTSTIDVSLVPTTIVNYTWYFGNGDSSTVKMPLYCYTTKTNDNKNNFYTIQLKAESNYGCIGAITKIDYLELLPKPIASFGASPTVAQLSTNLIEIVDKSINSVNTTWNYGVPYLPINTNAPAYHAISYNDSGNFVITQYVENKYGCTDTAKQYITIVKDYNLYIPQAFSPNDDALNDRFFPQFYGISKYNLVVFNRWGDIVARINETQSGWDGLNDSTQEKCKQDVYVWTLNFTTLRGNTGETTGRVTLIR